MSTYDQFFPEVLPYVPNCPEMSALNAIRNACIEFCTGTWFWTYDAYPQQGLTGVSDYTPDTPDGTKLLGVVDAWYGGQPLYPQDEATLRRRYGDRDFRDQLGMPRYWFQTDPDVVTVIPAPDDGAAASPNVLKMRVAVTPTRASNDVLDSVYERYAEDIARGALYRLKAVPGQPYTDLAGSQAAMMLFNKKIYSVRAEIERSMTRGPLRVRFNGNIT